jgi:methylase of polypeptide subunit release factors
MMDFRPGGMLQPVGDDETGVDGPTPDASVRDAKDHALLTLLRLLKERKYEFVTPSPATHARVVARPDRQRARCLEDVLGWTLAFGSGDIDPVVEDLLDRAAMLRFDGHSLRSKVRVSILRGQYFLHSAYPTSEADAVFFGPDSYRFSDLIQAELARRPLRPGAEILDIGTGSGVGAIVASLACRRARARMTDINPLALRFARINSAMAGATVETIHAATLKPIEGEFDFITANPPYIVDAQARLYRDGGGLHGTQVSLDMARMALDRLAPGGRMVLYTGSPIVGGMDGLRHSLAWEASVRDLDFDYRELDPDVFGEELEQPAYRNVERIALIAAVITRPQ